MFVSHLWLFVNEFCSFQFIFYLWPSGPPGPPMPRSILPRERSLIDRLVEGLVGDGPQNRYALICRECCSHNGMALKEEFEYISFRCCYCYRMNPARKVKANPPRLDLTPALKRRSPPKRGPNGKMRIAAVCEICVSIIIVVLFDMTMLSLWRLCCHASNA